MPNSIVDVPVPRNEPVLGYAPDSPERRQLVEALQAMSGRTFEIAPVIAGRRVRTGATATAVAPHDHRHVLATWHKAGAREVARAIAAARDAHPAWSRMSWEARAAIFLKAADLLAGPWRMRLNAATMLGQSKTCHQAEIDAACELIDFFRFNVHFMREIYAKQPVSSPGMWNTLEYRPITLGASVDGLRVVTTGLAASDVIVINGLQHVKPGIAVTPQKVAMDADRAGLAQIEAKPDETKTVLASGTAPGVRSQR